MIKGIPNDASHSIFKIPSRGEIDSWEDTQLFYFGRTRVFEQSFNLCILKVLAYIDYILSRALAIKKKFMSKNFKVILVFIRKPRYLEYILEYWKHLHKPLDKL